MQDATNKEGYHYLAFETGIEMQTLDHRKFMFEGQYSLTSKQLGFVPRLYGDWEFIFSSTAVNRIRPTLPPPIQKMLNTKGNHYLRKFTVVDFVFKRLI